MNELENIRNIEVFDFSFGIQIATQAIEKIIEDNYWKAYKPNPKRNYMITWYLVPFVILDKLVRYVILLPCRLVLLFFTFLFTLVLNLLVSLLPPGIYRQRLNSYIVYFFCRCISFIMFIVITKEGEIPSHWHNKIFVCNHTTVLDFILLNATLPKPLSFSIIGQVSTGAFGLIQRFVLPNNLWFDRTNKKSRQETKDRVTDFIKNPYNQPFLFFPEGSCVNNSYCCQFKKGFFELPNVEIVPMTIKYNDMFVDAYWNMNQSFIGHLLHMLSRYAVVAEINILKPTVNKLKKSGVEYSEDIKNKMCLAANLINVPWDGYQKKSIIPDKIRINAQKLTYEMFLNYHSINSNILNNNLDEMKKEEDIIAVDCQNDMEDLLKTPRILENPLINQNRIDMQKVLNKKRRRVSSIVK
eukprot:TRINITY_DN1873_c0_g2_i1.p1 TRINITY_DN1873_c0_g2~~TRINITY_DN1873_c0_g2_i1.p1  ORF type:complete len:412 (-),score=71.48 TRINITY_DN1873_c0_g2_i1:74-1309(-)